MRLSDKRGNNRDRRRRKERMLEVFGDGASVVCTWCPAVCSFSDVTADRLDPGESYRFENIVPSCGPCNFRRKERKVWQWVHRGAREPKLDRLKNHPLFADTRVMRQAVVRGWGFKATHWIDAPEALFGWWDTEDGAEFEGVEKPIVGQCGKLIRSSGECLVVMKDALPSCQTCFEKFTQAAQEYRKKYDL